MANRKAWNEKEKVETTLPSGNAKLVYPSDFVNIERTPSGRYSVVDAVTGNIINFNIRSWEEALKRADLATLDTSQQEIEIKQLSELQKEGQLKGKTVSEWMGFSDESLYAAGDVWVGAGPGRWVWLGGSANFSVWYNEKTGKYYFSQKVSGGKDKHYGKSSGMTLSELEDEIDNLQDRFGEEISFQQQFEGASIPQVDKEKFLTFEGIPHVGEVRKGMIDPKTKVIVPISQGLTPDQEKGIRKRMSTEEADDWIERFNAAKLEIQRSPARKAQEEGHSYPNIEL